MAAMGDRTNGAVFGREPELARAEAFLTAAGERFAAMLVEGEPGIGKTTVWREVARRAEGRGFRVLAARPAEAETKLALSTVADLLEHVPAEAFAALPEPQRWALEVALLRVEPAAAPLEARTVATAVRSLLRGLSAERPLLVAVDDAQWLDPTSSAVLEFALRRLTSRQVGWLFARRLHAPAHPAVERLVPPDALSRQVLGPLDPAALHHVLDHRLGEPLSRPALARIDRASGGNPFYALEIARALAGAAAIDAGPFPPLTDRLRELIVERVPAGSPAREALLAAAALSHPTAEVVERASSAAALEAAEESGLLRVVEGRIRFAHPLYAGAVYAAAATRRRRALHERLAGLVADPEERARHLALAVAGPDEDIARALEEAAGLSRARGAWDAGAELLERAHTLTPPDRSDEAARRAVLAAEHHVRAGDRCRARALLEEVLARSLPRAVLAHALRLLAEISYHDENFAEAERLFAAALGCADDPRPTGAIELGLSYVQSNLMDFGRARGHAYRALERAEAAGDRSLAAQALAHCAMMDFLCARGVDWAAIQRSLSMENADAAAPLARRPSTLAAFLLLYVGRHTEARQQLEAVCAGARERGDESDLAFVLLWLSWLETRSGKLARAAELAGEAASIAVLTGSPSMHAWALTQQAYVHAHRGAADDVRRCCTEAATPVRRSGNRLPAIWVAASTALLELSLGDHAAAWRACEPLTAAVEAAGVGEPVVAFFLPDALEALIALGRLDRAEALLEAFEARAHELDRLWALATGGRCRGLLLAARGDLDAASAALQRALDEHACLDMPFEHARTLLATGVVERRARRRACAKASFERALSVFEDVGARLWAARARAELERTGLRRTRAGDLTAAERRVAQLAAQGLTNREVAASLFLSPKTVDANLSRVYRKLGIASRAQLGARMASPVQA